MTASLVSRSVLKAVRAVPTPEGVGAIVKRSIGSRELRNLSPFLMLDEFESSEGSFPDHPHRGQATVSYMLAGKTMHEDSMGNTGTLETGDLQWMIAGRGIMHSEVPVYETGQPNPKGLQLWVDLPAEKKMMPPSYQEHKAKDIKTAHPEEGITIRVISGESHGVTGLVRHVGGCHYYDVRLARPGQTVFQPIPEGWTAFVYTLTGAFSLGSKTYSPSTTVVLSSEAGQAGVLLGSAPDAQGETRFVLIAGEPLNQRVVQHGPFVLTSEKDVVQTFEDYREGKNGFESAVGWESEIGKPFRR